MTRLNWKVGNKQKNFSFFGKHACSLQCEQEINVRLLIQSRERQFAKKIGYDIGFPVFTVCLMVDKQENIVPKKMPTNGKCYIYSSADWCVRWRVTLRGALRVFVTRSRSSKRKARASWLFEVSVKYFHDINAGMDAQEVRCMSGRAHWPTSVTSSSCSNCLAGFFKSWLHRCASRSFGFKN